MSEMQVPQAGWFPDPLDPNQLRYWDGSAWTEHVSPAQQVQQPAAAPQVAATVGVATSATGLAQPAHSVQQPTVSGFADDSDDVDFDSPRSEPKSAERKALGMPLRRAVLHVTAIVVIVAVIAIAVGKNNQTSTPPASATTTAAFCKAATQLNAGLNSQTPASGAKGSTPAASSSTAASSLDALKTMDVTTPAPLRSDMLVVSEAMVPLFSDESSPNFNPTTPAAQSASQQALKAMSSPQMAQIQSWVKSNCAS